MVLSLLAAIGPPAAAFGQGPPAPPSPSPSPVPSPSAAPPPPIVSPFRLGLTYVNVLSEDGPTANDGIATHAVGIDLAFASTTYVRNHLGLAHQWESEGAYSARGFRINLISLGYPIELFRRGAFRLDLEPVLNVLRGEILFVTDADALLRLSAGAGLELAATYRRWSLAIQPQVDFRYLATDGDETDTSFTRRFPLRLTIGHEF